MLVAVLAVPGVHDYAHMDVDGLGHLEAKVDFVSPAATDVGQPGVVFLGVGVHEVGLLHAV